MAGEPVWVPPGVDVKRANTARVSAEDAAVPGCGDASPEARRTAENGMSQRFGRLVTGR